MRVTVNEKALYFDVDGKALAPDGSDLKKKPTLILLHGAPGNSDHTVFKPMFDVLTDVAQVVYLDLAGCGRSDDPADGVYSLESWADDLKEFCDVLGIEKPVVLGNSAGGMVAATYGIRHPGHAGKLILSSTQARLEVGRCLDMFEKLGGSEARAVAHRALVTHGDLESFKEYAAKCMTLYNPTPQNRPRHSIFRYPSADAFHKLGGVWHQLDILEDLHTITCPTMILVGDQDPVTPLQDSEDMRAHINPAILRYERFENAGHGVWLDDPERAFAVIRSFITEEAGVLK